MKASIFCYSLKGKETARQVAMILKNEYDAEIECFAPTRLADLGGGRGRDNEPIDPEDPEQVSGYGFGPIPRPSGDFYGRHFNDKDLLVSVGSVKGVEIGDGFAASKTLGSINNDNFRMDNGVVTKVTNHSGGILGGISDGDDIIVRCAIKPTPSIAQVQATVNEKHEDVGIEIHGRHDPVIVPRAVVVVEAMCAITICDALLSHMTDRVDYIKEFYKN